MPHSTAAPLLDSRERVRRRTLRQEVIARLLAAVFERRFRSGERLVVQRLAEQYGVSPTPVREALVELAGLGIVDLLPNRGAAVRPFGPVEVREISQVRRILEVDATRGACGRVPADELAALEAELTRLSRLPQSAQWDADTRAADTWLHTLIADACGSTRLKNEIARYRALFQALRDVSHACDATTNYARSDDTQEHLAVVRALAAGDADAAAAAMDRHVRSVALYLEEVLFGASATAAPADR